MPARGPLLPSLLRPRPPPPLPLLPPLPQPHPSLPVLLRLEDLPQAQQV